MDRLIIRRLHDMEAEEGPEPGAALRRLTVCRGGFTLDAAAAILGLEDDPGLVERRLATLRGWQFITWHVIANGQRRERYIIDPLVAAAAGTDPDARHAHYAYYAALAQRSRDTGDTSALNAEGGNLEAAFEWALDQDLAAAYSLYAASADFFTRTGHAAEQLGRIKRIAAAVGQHSDPLLCGAIFNALGAAYQNHPGGERRENLHQAIHAYRRALEHYDPTAAPQARATVQHNLGTAHADLSRFENRAENLWKAIAAYSVALHERPPEIEPAGYIATKNAMGTALRDMAGIDHRALYLEQAIRAYQDALNIAAPDSADTAALQNNLGNAYRDLAGMQDLAGNLRRAIDAYHAALQIRTPQAAPLDYAATQNNLGTAYRALADQDDQARNLCRAVTAFEEALRYYTPQQTPLDYAAARNNLGGAYRALAKIENAPANLGRAVAAFEDALRYATPQTAPLDYARTQANLGLARQDLGDRAGAVACWREAAQQFQRMGEIDKADLMLEWITAAGADQIR